MTSVPLENAFWIIWVDYGPAGWKPAGYRSQEDAAEALLSGGQGGPMLITSGPMRVRFED